MRGLTDAEHTVLTIMVELAGRPSDPNRADLTHEQAALCAVLQSTRGLCVGKSYGAFNTWNITALGRLALRLENAIRSRVSVES